MLALSTPTQKRLAYGFWRFQEQDVEIATELLAFVRESGIDHLDTADCYGGASGFGGAEKMLGALRQHAPSLFEGAFLATKAGVEFGTPYNSAPDYLATACEASLKRLRVERVDLFYVHRHDLTAHPAEVAGALDGLVAAGKVAAVGVSNYTPAQVAALARHLKAPLAAHQIEFSAAHVEALFDGTLDQCMERGFPAIAWSPLAGGRIGATGDPPTEAPLARLGAVLDEIGARHGAPREAVAVAFIQRHASGATPILGTTTKARLKACLAARDVSLTRAEWYAILEARLGRRMP